MRGISTPVIALILVITTLFAMLGVFVLYSYYFSGIANGVFTDSYISSLSKLVQIQISTLTFKGVSPSYKYFNVSYLIWVQAPTKTVTVLVFTAGQKELSKVFYSLPTQSKVGIFKLNVNSYTPIPSFTLNAPVYLPQGGTLLGNVYAQAFNVSSNATYVLSAIVKQNQVVVIWVLFSYLGKWYRLDFTYTNPASEGLGIYVVTSTGIFSQSSKQLSGVSAPHYLTTQTGDSFGFWFYSVNTQTQGQILNLTYYSVGNNNRNVSIVLFQNNIGQLCVNYTTSKSPSIIEPIASLNQGSWYFVNITTGSQLGLTSSFEIQVYSNGKVLSSVILNNAPSLNGYQMSVKFGSPTLIVGISQAYFVSLQNQQGVTSFYNVSSQIFNNGYYYNNTNNLYWIIYNSPQNLYSVVYWDFAIGSSTPPSSIPGIIWYWTQNSNTLYTYYLYPSGPNTYVIV